MSSVSTQPDSLFDESSTRPVTPVKKKTQVSVMTKKEREERKKELSDQFADDEFLLNHFAI